MEDKLILLVEDNPHAVRMTISRLKQKLGGEDARVTVNSYRSSGYRLEEQ